MQKLSKILANVGKKSAKVQQFLTKKLRLENVNDFVKFFCSRLFAKCFDLRSWLSVSSPHRSVGTLSLLPRGSFVYQTRRKPCTLSISLGIVAQLSDKWKPEYWHLGIFILYSRDLSLQPPFAEVLSGLLRAAYWPLVFSFSSFSGLVWPGPFSPFFASGFQNGAKECIV